MCRKVVTNYNSFLVTIIIHTILIFVHTFKKIWTDLIPIMCKFYPPTHTHPPSLNYNEAKLFFMVSISIAMKWKRKNKLCLFTFWSLGIFLASHNFVDFFRCNKKGSFKWSWQITNALLSRIVVIDGDRQHE